MNSCDIKCLIARTGREVKWKWGMDESEIEKLSENEEWMTVIYVLDNTTKWVWIDNTVYLAKIFFLSGMQWLLD